MTIFFYLQTYLCLQEEAGTTVKKLNSREALKAKEKKKKKQTNCNKGLPRGKPAWKGFPTSLPVSIPKP